MRKKHCLITSFLFSFILCGLLYGAVSADTVRIREETLHIPTYLTGPPDKNPRFYSGRAYQGAKGPVYPYPMMDRLTDIREERAYQAVILENRYIEVCILPEIGGRIFYAVDKTNGYDLFYRQHVIKPALIGMLGAWISGGVEWCIPHHHRATTFMPVDCTLECNGDGSKTVWIGEHELRHRTRWILGLTLHPGKSMIDVQVKYFNRTPWIHSFLYWSNVAVHANEDYQVIFPPSTQYAAYHGKNQFAEWPFHSGLYRGVDYPDHTDLSWYKHHPSPTSLFAWESDADFLAGYDHGKRAGVIHVADHHVVPGKKLWTWGTGEQGKRWEKMLTDTDGPYLELMVGAYSDNQPDYSWIQPYEVKTFRQVWYPLNRIGGVKHANMEAALNVEVDEADRLFIGCNTTRAVSDARIQLLFQGRILTEILSSIAPDRPFTEVFNLDPQIPREEVEVKIILQDEQELIRYQSVPVSDSFMPEPVQPPLHPEEYKTTEALYFTGLRLEQFYNPIFDPIPYYEEGLRRNPDDARINTMMGIQLASRGQFKEAEKNLRAAIKTVTDRYTRPRDGEALYYLGWVLRFQGRNEDAYSHFARSAWDAAYFSAASFAMAELDCRERRWKKALAHLRNALRSNTEHPKAANLMGVVLRRTNCEQEARRVNREVLARDPLNFWAINESVLLCRELGLTSKAEQAERRLFESIRTGSNTVLELAFDYAGAGFWKEGIDVLERFIERKSSGADVHILYTLSYFYMKKGERKEADRYLHFARSGNFDFCFPFRLEMLDVLQYACNTNGEDAGALYLIGNLLYDLQPEKAIDSWIASLHIDDTNGRAHRNLGMAYASQSHDLERAVNHLEHAVELLPNDPRLYYELDLLYEMSRKEIQTRLKLLRDHHATVSMRDDALSREILLHTLMRDYDTAIRILRTHHFHTWEGGGRIHDVYVDAHLQRGIRHMQNDRPSEALSDFEAALRYPDNLEVGRPLRDFKAVRTHYYLGLALNALGRRDRAIEHFRIASEPGFDTHFHESSFYRAKSLEVIGRVEEAGIIYERLVGEAQKRLKTDQSADFFTKFGERQTMENRMAQTLYLAGLGYAGLHEKRSAAAMFERALRMNPNHRWASMEWIIP